MNGYNVLKYGATGIAAPDMSFYDRLRAEKTTAGLPLTTITGIPPISFKSDGSPLDNVTIIGNGQQTGTPAPDDPIYPEFVGTLADGSWTISITCGGQTVTVDLSQAQTLRRIKKLVLTGDESYSYVSGSAAPFRIKINGLSAFSEDKCDWLCSHFPSLSYSQWSDSGSSYSAFLSRHISDTQYYLRFKDTAYSTLADFVTWISEQYAAGTPVCIWYVLAEPTTGIINEPLARIGDFSDELRSTDAGITIPTVRGSNTLTIDTTVQPSSVSITGHIKPI